MAAHKGFPEFEVVDAYGARWRYKRAEGYSWQFALREGSTELQDKSTVEVLHTDEDGDYMVVATFPRIAMVGDVTPNTCLNFNLRES